MVGLTFFLILGGSRVQFANLTSGLPHALLIPYAYISASPWPGAASAVMPPSLATPDDDPPRPPY